MIDLLGAIRRRGRSTATSAPAAGAPQAPVSSRHAATAPEAGAPATQEPPHDADVGCDPYNSGMFDRADSWSRVNKRS
ncbi:MAG TPA: hypothetical protein VM616_05075 [Gammaproteobacteria bacterium]|nr:hypothetical protein [Gammaproteobacteria bacterium]